MLLAYLLLFLLHLSASTCHATSRNHHIFFGIINPGAAAAADVPAPSPAAIHDHRRTAKDLLSYDARHPYAMKARWGATPPPPLLSGVDDMRPPDMENSVAMAPSSPSPSPSSSPDVVDNGGYGEGGELGGGGGGGVGGGNGGDGGPPSEDTGLEESVTVDYAEPQTHPPSHN